MSSELVERMFAVLGLRLRLDVEPADSHLDTAIERVRADLTGLQEHWVSNWRSLLWWAPTPHLPVVVDGELAALLQGVPIPVNRVDLVVAERDLDRLADWIARLPNKLRYRGGCVTSTASTTTPGSPDRCGGVRRWLSCGCG